MKPDITFLSDTTRPNNHNPLTTNYFRMSIGRAPTVAYFAQVSNIPGIGLAELTQPTTLSTAIPIPGNQYIFEPLQVQFLLDEELRGWKEIYNWITSIAMYKEFSELAHQDKFSSITLTITNSAYKGKFEIMFFNAFPVSLSPIPLSVTDTDNRTLSGTASFRYSHYTITDLT